MKRVISLILVLVLTFSFAGCKKNKDEDNPKGTTISPGDLPETVFSSPFVFALDETDWYSSLTIKDDATFTGEYFTEKKGTVYFCNYSGKFNNIRVVNDHTYSLVLEEVNIEDYIGKVTMKNGKEYKVTYPYGIQNGKRFLLYTPDTPVSEIATSVLSWWPFLEEHKTNPYETLSCYALVNEETNEAFFIREN